MCITVTIILTDIMNIYFETFFSHQMLISVSDVHSRKKYKHILKLFVIYSE